MVAWIPIPAKIVFGFAVLGTPRRASPVTLAAQTQHARAPLLALEEVRKVLVLM